MLQFLFCPFAPRVRASVSLQAVRRQRSTAAPPVSACVVRVRRPRAPSACAVRVRRPRAPSTCVACAASIRRAAPCPPAPRSAQPPSPLPPRPPPWCADESTCVMLANSTRVACLRVFTRQSNTDARTIIPQSPCTATRCNATVTRAITATLDPQQAGWHAMQSCPDIGITRRSHLCSTIGCSHCNLAKSDKISIHRIFMVCGSAGSREARCNTGSTGEEGCSHSSHAL